MLVNLFTNSADRTANATSSDGKWWINTDMFGFVGFKYATNLAINNSKPAVQFASGLFAAAPPRRMMNKRRLMLVPRPWRGVVTAQICILRGLGDARYGSIATEPTRASAD
jgi:hypothetical protein